MAAELSCASEHKNGKEKPFRGTEKRANWLKKLSAMANGSISYVWNAKMNRRTDEWEDLVLWGPADAIHPTNFSLNKSCGNRRLKRLCVGLKPNSGIYFLVYFLSLLNCFHIPAGHLPSSRALSPPHLATAIAQHMHGHVSTSTYISVLNELCGKFWLKNSM